MENSARWLIFSDDFGLGLEVAQQITDETACSVVRVAVGEEFSRIAEDNYRLNPRRRADYDALFERLGREGKTPTRIIHLWSVSPTESTLHERGQLEAAHEAGLHSLLFVAQALAKNDLTEPLQLDVIATGTQKVAPTEMLRPGKAGLLGACRVIPQEYSNISCRIIDIELPDNAQQPDRQLARQILAEAVSGRREPVIAYRGSARFVQSFEAVALDKPPENATRLKKGGVYLITGGLGKIGLVVARHLAEKFAAKLVLLGRTKLPEKARWPDYLDSKDSSGEVASKIRQLVQLEKLGAEVLVLEADVSDFEVMRAALDQVYDRFGRLDGVFHASGISGKEAFCPIAEMGVHDIAQHFLPKAQGLFVLEQLLRDRPIDFLLTFSSLSAVLGGVGFAAYSAANLCADSFIQQRNSAGRGHWITVNWDAWSFNEREGQNGSDRVSDPELALTPSEGIEVLERVLSVATPAQVVISTGNLEARMARSIKLAQRQEGQNPTAGDHIQPPVMPLTNTVYAAPRNAIERSLAEIWRELLGVEQIGINDDFFDLKGDSLLAVQVISRVRSAFNVQMSVHKLFDGPTVAELAAKIESELRAGQEAKEKTAKILQFVEQLSDSEAKALIEKGRS